jgi:hypothetical protein
MTVDLNFLASGDQLQLVPFVVSGTCEGARAVAQKVIISLLTDSQDPLRFGEGGGLGSLVGRANSTSSELSNRLTLSVASTAEAIRQEQQTDTSLTDSERLAPVGVENFAQAGDAVQVELTVTTVAGEVATANLNIGAGA